MSISTTVQKIWGMCNILRGDGIGYNQYMSELTYLLFLKIAEETGAEKGLPENRRWNDLASHPEEGILGKYRKILTHLGEEAENPIIREIYRFPTTVFKHDENLKAVVEKINNLEWHSIARDSFGDIYEGLLAKNAHDSRAGAGQYFTPRALVDSIVRVMKPQIGEVIQDPSTGTGGFLISADNYIRSNSTKTEYSKNNPKYEGCEIEENTYRLCLMNIFLHNMDATIIYGDGLTNDVEGKLQEADLIIANPPFGSKSGSARKQKDSIKFPSSNKQLDFLQHIYNSLKVGGRAAVVLPDNVLFEDGTAKTIRQDLMDKCNLHTILKLPTGIFYATGVKANVLFFTKGKTLKNSTQNVWVYDMRTDQLNFNKGNPLKESHFKEFEESFGNCSSGTDKRVDQGERGRFRKFTSAEIKKRDDNLDISWLRDENATDHADLPEPDIIAAQIMENLQTALTEMEALQSILDDSQENSNG